MRRRDQHMQTVRQQSLTQLKDVSSQKEKYSELLKFLIGQGLQTILERNVLVQCRKEDQDLVKKAIPAGIKLYQDTMEKATQIVPKVDVKIDEKNWLPAGSKGDDSQLSCAGGVVLTAKNGQIVCRNTLDAR